MYAFNDKIKEFTVLPTCFNSLFTEKIGELQATFRRDLATLKAGKPLTRLRYSWTIKNHALVNIWDRLDDGLPTQDFLILSSALLSKNFHTITNDVNN